MIVLAEVTEEHNIVKVLNCQISSQMLIIPCLCH